jgi:hypothetical protein
MEPSVDWKEIIPADEEARLEEAAQKLVEMQRARAVGGVTRRALHAKAHAGVEAELTVLPDLPAHAQVGLFSAPATYRAYVRYSNGGGLVLADGKPDARGMAVKVVGVGGKKIIPSMQDAKTQDFLAITVATQPLRDAYEFLWLVRAAAGSQLTFLPKAIARFGVGRGLRLVRTLLRTSGPIPSLATRTFYSSLPIQFGKHAVKFAFAPQATTEPARGKTRDYLGEELAARLAAGPLVYDFRVQFFADEKTTPIEDASGEWTTPFLTIGRLTIPKQDMASARSKRVAELVEKMSFDPWHAQEDLRPLGNMMRARNHAYRMSTKERGAASEPDGTEKFE